MRGMTRRIWSASASKRPTRPTAAAALAWLEPNPRPSLILLDLDDAGDGRIRISRPDPPKSRRSRYSGAGATAKELTTPNEISCRAHFAGAEKSAQPIGAAGRRIWRPSLSAARRRPAPRTANQPGGGAGEDPAGRGQRNEPRHAVAAADPQWLRDRHRGRRQEGVDIAGPRNPT